MSTTANDRPTQILPTAGPAGPVRRSIFPNGTLPAPTATLPAVTLPTAAGADWRGRALTEELKAVPARALHRSPGRALRHLRRALVGTLLAAALLTGLQLYAAAGISDARQAALEQAALAPALPALPAGQSPSAPQTDWLIEGTTTAAPSPLDLPRCTTSPDTPLPCLATISPAQDRAVVLEEDASLTALARR